MERIVKAIAPDMPADRHVKQTRDVMTWYKIVFATKTLMVPPVNIIKTRNDALASGTVTGVHAVNMLRKYIDEAYNGYYGENRADLFIGQNAAWDADELVALLRCVVANAQTLNGTDTVYGLFSREDDNNQRRVDMFRFAGTLFGVRGMESRQDYLYVDVDGTLKDARQEVATYEALARMHDMVAEGLISQADDIEVAMEMAEEEQDESMVDEAGEMLSDLKEKTAALADGVYLFATATCPNCKIAMPMLDKAGVPYVKLLAEENAELMAKNKFFMG